jgi:hypothetical protein
MSKKLQNVNAVNKMLAGEHKFQTNTTHTFSKSNKDTKKRLVGEIWEETDSKSGITYLYEQKDGYVMKTKRDSETLQSTQRFISIIFKMSERNMYVSFPKSDRSENEINPRNVF